MAYWLITESVLTWLYLRSRRAPAGIGLLAVLGAVLWTALHSHRSVAGGPAAQALIPVTIEAGAAAVIAVTTHGPFGDPERATGRWLPWLRLAAAVTLTAAAFGALAAGAAGGFLPGGTLALLLGLPAWAGEDLQGLAPSGPQPSLSGPVYAAARRFAALPTSERHAWLAAHLAALRSGRITLGQLP